MRKGLAGIQLLDFMSILLIVGALGFAYLVATVPTITGGKVSFTVKEGASLEEDALAFALIAQSGNRPELLEQASLGDGNSLQLTHFEFEAFFENSDVPETYPCMAIQGTQGIRGISFDPVAGIPCLAPCSGTPDDLSCPGLLWPRLGMIMYTSANGEPRTIGLLQRGSS